MLPHAGVEMEQRKPEEDRRAAGQDPLLHPFLGAPDEESAKAELDTLLRTEAMPIIQNIINQKLGAGAAPRNPQSIDERDLDAQDLRQQTLMALTAHLWQVYAVPGQNRIGAFRAYVAGASFNTWRAAVRDETPLWTRLSFRLTYLCRESAGQIGFTKWQDEKHGPLVGFTVWRRKRLAPVLHFALLEKNSIDELPSPATPLPELAAWALQQAGGPLPWNDFVTTVAFVLQVKDERISLDRGNLDLLLKPQTLTVETAGESLNRDRLRRLWEQMQRLDRKERAVLVLKAEDLLDFELSQVATLQDLATSIGVSLSQILTLLPSLPLDDRQIARLLGIRRQTVVNLRSQARFTLRRRLQGKTGDE
jgi:DNA-directed RNA polymerase specialized sigma24 family protein